MNSDKKEDEEGFSVSEWAEDAPPSLADRFFSFLRKVLPLGLILLMVLIVMEFLSDESPEMLESNHKEIYSEGDISVGPSTFRSLYIDTHEGINRMRTLRNLRIDGRIRAEESEIDFFVIHQLPNRFLSRIYQGDKQISHGRTGTDDWVSVRKANQVLMVEDLPQSEAEEVFQELYPLHDLLLHKIPNGSDSILSVETTDRNGETFFIVEQAPTMGETSVEYVFSSNRYTPVERRAHYPDGSFREWVFSDHRIVGGFWFPHRIRFYVNGELVSEMEIIRMRHNTGVVGLTFERPQVSR